MGQAGFGESHTLVIRAPLVTHSRLSATRARARSWRAAAASYSACANHSFARSFALLKCTACGNRSCVWRRIRAIRGSRRLHTGHEICERERYADLPSARVGHRPLIEIDMGSRRSRRAVAVHTHPRTISERCMVPSMTHTAAVKGCALKRLRRYAQRRASMHNTGGAGGGAVSRDTDRDCRQGAPA